ncbi:peptidase inhibitor family I36 protein [Protaetiibacter intestinalis]|uniref:peptidase inhibitor family I36 protein n=1 Tax=Protaetiibacter intestinalis TaxID=2419774 RepID=UPI0013004670|nr:peptidase inhibitor family I36 protein [Protaetiibacter intestinalis]
MSANASELEAPNAAQAQIDRILEANPGGEQIAPGQISWDSGSVVLTLEEAVTPYVLSACASGRYCAWSSPAYAGTLLSFSSCSAAGTISTAGFPIRSIANQRTSGHITAGSYSLSAGTSLTSISGTITSITCYTG